MQAGKASNGTRWQPPEPPHPGPQASRFGARSSSSAPHAVHGWFDAGLVWRCGWHVWAAAALPAALWIRMQREAFSYARARRARRSER